MYHIDWSIDTFPFLPYLPSGACAACRLVYVRARDHESDARRPVFASPESYPRYVGKLRRVHTHAHALTRSHTHLHGWE